MYKRRFWRLFDTRQNPYEKPRRQKSSWNFKPDARRRKPRCLRALRKSFKKNNKPQQAIKLYEQACDKGSARGCELLGDYYETRSKQAYFYANKACEIDKQRCLLLGGILYFEDKFVQSFKATEKSCYSQKYYISSCLMAAMAYENKLKNFMKKPKKLYSTLCERAPHRKEDFCAEAQ